MFAVLLWRLVEMLMLGLSFDVLVLRALSLDERMLLGLSLD